MKSKIPVSTSLEGLHLQNLGQLSLKKKRQLVSHLERKEALLHKRPLEGWAKKTMNKLIDLKNKQRETKQLTKKMVKDSKQMKMLE